MRQCDSLTLARQLIQCQSVTPDDAGCQDIMIERLLRVGFSITRLPFGEVSNFWATHGSGGPILAFAGHTDVVPTGPESQWTHPPFAAVLDEDLLHGRGAADMKSSLAAMITATERFVATSPNHPGQIAFLITSDEEGPAIDGTVKVMAYLQEKGIAIKWCIVGEPTSSAKLGDTIKNGRRGSLNGQLTVRGTQGHVAYPQLADNPIHRVSPALAALAETVWDRGNAHFPATSFQISNIQAGTGATNVIPGDISVTFNFRFSTEQTAASLKQHVTQLLNQQHLNYELDWQLSGEPFLTEQGRLIEATRAAVSRICGYQAELSTSGGTSDGRFIAPTGAELIELGPCNASIHKINEHVASEDVHRLSHIYEDIILNLLHG